MTRGGNTHSGFRIASTFVISREKNSYASVEVVVYTHLITQHWLVFPKLLLLLDGRRLVDTFPAPPPIPRKRIWRAVKCMYQIWQSYLWGIVSIQETTWGNAGNIFSFTTGLKLAFRCSPCRNDITAKYDIFTYCPKKDNWILDERVENNFIAPLQCRRIYLCVI